jgi:hypothetical protein
MLVLPLQPPLQNSTELTAPIAMVIISQHGPHRKHRSSTVAIVSVTAGTCLPSCCPETGCVTLFTKNLLPYQRALFRYRYLASGLHATVRHGLSRQNYGRRDLSTRSLVLISILFETQFNNFLTMNDPRHYLMTVFRPTAVLISNLEYSVLSARVWVQQRWSASPLCFHGLGLVACYDLISASVGSPAVIIVILVRNV